MGQAVLEQASLIGCLEVQSCLQYTRLERFVSEKHSHLLGPSIKTKEMKCCEYGPRLSNDYLN
jgi:hypothetical protein